MDRGWLPEPGGWLRAGEGGVHKQGCWPWGSIQPCVPPGAETADSEATGLLVILNLLFYLGPTSPASMGLQCP